MYIEVKDTGAQIPSSTVSIESTLKHHSVVIESESETQGKQLKK